MTLTFRTDLPDPAEYHALFETTGWNQTYQATAEELAHANAKSWYVVSAYDEDALVAFGRVVSDGVLHAMIYDMIVRPDHQGMGLGSRVLAMLVERCRAAGIRDVQLFSARGKKDFYVRNGFAERPQEAPGMQLVSIPPGPPKEDARGMGRREPGPLDDGLVETYLGILGVPRKPPTAGLLKEIVGAHAARIPFENVSKLHRMKTLRLTALPDLRLFLTGIQEYGFGGTCYANNHHLFSLLGALGFDVTLCGADMASPNVHMVVRVRLGGREVLVDAGYAAPFREPLPADLDTDHVVTWGGDRYVLRPKDPAGRSRLELHRDGKLKHGYVVNPEPRRIEDFEGVIADSFRPEATFRNALLLARFSRERSVVIHNLSLVESDGFGSTTRQMRDRSELAGNIEAHFGIPVPIVEGVLDDLPAFVDPWS